MQPDSLSILLIQGRNAIAPGVAAALTRVGLRVTAVAEGGQGQVEARARRYDCVLLDLGDAWESAIVLRALRADLSLPIIVIAATGHAVERISALDAGADDCVNAPISSRVLCTRIAATVRRIRRASASLNVHHA